MSKNIREERHLSSLFDYGLYLFSFLCPVFFWLPLETNMVQGMFFVFGVFFLKILSFSCPAQKHIKNSFLTIIGLLSLISVFVHSFDFELSKNTVRSFINFCLMSEGFIYIFCGCMLYDLIVNYKNKFNIAYPALAITILNTFFAVSQAMGYKLIWTRNMSVVTGMMGIAPHLTIFSAVSIPILFKMNKYLIIMPVINIVLAFVHWNGTFTGIVSLFITLLLYCLVKKRSYVWMFIPLASLFFLHPALNNKFLLRINLYVWTLKEIFAHPFLGWGFDNSISNNMVNYGIGWMYRHNDYLNIARDLGLPFLIVILSALTKSFRKMKIDYLWISLVTLLISGLTWTTFYFVRLGVLGIVLIALKDVETNERHAGIG